MQASLYRMATKMLEEHGGVRRVSYELPNKHYIAVDMGYIGIDNLTPLSGCLCFVFRIC